MKMIYQTKHIKHHQPNRNFLKIFLIFLLIGVLIFLFNIFNPMRYLVTETLSPFLKSGNYFYKTFGKIPKFFSNKNKLIEENNLLLDQIENDHLSEIDYQLVKDENQRLRMELKLKSNRDLKTVSVIAKPPQIPLDSLFLDKGMKDGINNGDFVLASDKILVGKIIETSKNKSTTALSSFTGVVSYGFVSRTDEPLEIKGIGGGNMEARVPIDFDILVGDQIMIGHSFNYLIAIVGVVEEDSSSGFKNILLSLPVDIAKINFAFVESVTNE